jgi:hypothetical protein
VLAQSRVITPLDCLILVVNKKYLYDRLLTCLFWAKLLHTLNTTDLSAYGIHLMITKSHTNLIEYNCLTCRPQIKKKLRGILRGHNVAVRRGDRNAVVQAAHAIIATAMNALVLDFQSLTTNLKAVHLFNRCISSNGRII